jgi:hypothetical protein
MTDPAEIRQAIEHSLERALRPLAERLRRMEKEVFADEIRERRLLRLAQRMALAAPLLPALVPRWIQEVQSIQEDGPEAKWADYPARADQAELNNRAVLLEMFAEKARAALRAGTVTGTGVVLLKELLVEMDAKLAEPINPVKGPAAILDNGI